MSRSLPYTNGQNRVLLRPAELGAGYGLLIKVDGLTLENFKTTYQSLGNELGFPLDSGAAMATQYTIQSYDEDAYINYYSTTWLATTVNTPTSLPYKKKKKKKKKKKRNAIETGEKETIRYDNLDEKDFMVNVSVLE